MVFFFPRRSGRAAERRARAGTGGCCCWRITPGSRDFCTMRKESRIADCILIADSDVSSGLLRSVYRKFVMCGVVCFCFCFCFLFFCFFVFLGGSWALVACSDRCCGYCVLHKGSATQSSVSGLCYGTVETQTQTQTPTMKR